MQFHFGGTEDRGPLLLLSTIHVVGVFRSLGPCAIYPHVGAIPTLSVFLAESRECILLGQHKPLVPPSDFFPVVRTGWSGFELMSLAVAGVIVVVAHNIGGGMTTVVVGCCWWSVNRPMRTAWPVGFVARSTACTDFTVPRRSLNTHARTRPSSFFVLISKIQSANFGNCLTLIFVPVLIRSCHS